MGKRIARIALYLAVSTALLVGVLLVSFRLAAAQRETEGLADSLPPFGELNETREGRIFTIEKGKPDDPAVLFAHGTAAWSGLWMPTLSAISVQGYRTIAFDMPPFGFSEHAADLDYSRSRQAERVIALLQSLDTKPIMVAHSVGAGPVTEAVMARPDLVSGLIIVDGALALNGHLTPNEVPVFLRPKKMRSALVSATATNPMLTERFLQNFMFVKDVATPDVVTTLQRPMKRLGYTEAVAAWVPQLFVPPQKAASTRPENWQALAVPLAFIWGDRDTVTPLSQAQALQKLVAGSQLIVLPDVGHIPQLEDPGKFQNALLDALEHVKR
ncbi:alpha/beta fold hydrolase [Roseobacter sp. EG26]|uniref:alpha/beta fold hydrolase n=1 Tax=Roseobacter sp. EG26 TaxID=3412477 RepID=UPI003CE573D9